MKKIALILIAACLSACGYTTTQPIDSPEKQKESKIGAVTGGAVGAGIATMTGNPYMMAVLVPVGATVGYYVPKIKNQTQAIDQAGGAVFQVGDYVTIVLPSDHVFDIGTANYLANGEILINESAQIIDDFPNSLVLVSAYGDNVDSELAQAKLTRQQAQRIALSLWESRELDNTQFERFQFIGMGSTQAIADNATIRGQALNRRIQITIYPKK